MKKHLQYASYVLRHKWYVFVECCKLGIPLRGLLHDLSKLRPSEWLPYVEFFYGKRVAADGYMHKPGTSLKFDTAWLRHQHRNPHHWQFWVLREDDGDKLAAAVRRVLTDAAQDDIESGGPCSVQRGPGKDYIHIVRLAIDQLSEAAKSGGVKVLEMPLVYAKEMVADWRGAGKAQGVRLDCAYWYLENKDKMLLHPATRARVEKELGL